MWFKWDGWYQRDMVLIWNTKDELVWIQYLDMNEDELKRLVWGYVYDKYYLIDWAWLVCGQCVIPWNL